MKSQSSKCPRCGRGYGSAAHRRQCRGLTRGQARPRKRSYSARACSGPDWGRVLAVPAGGRVVADGSFFKSEPAASPAQEVQS